MGKIDDEIESIASDIAEKQSVAIMGKFSVLMKTINAGVEELLDNQGKIEYFDKDLGKQISDAVEKAITAFAKLPPTPVQKAPIVNISSPQVNVDLTPLKSIASDITQQNKNLISALEKSGNGGTDLYRLVVSMMSRQNDIIDKLITAINKPMEKEVEKEKPRIEKLKIVKDNYNTYLVPEYSKLK